MPSPDREKLKRRAHELGVKHPPNVKLERLAELVAAAEVEAAKSVEERVAEVDEILPIAAPDAEIHEMIAEAEAADHDEPAEDEAKLVTFVDDPVEAAEPVFGSADVLLDGAAPAWAQGMEIGPRHVTLIAKAGEEPAAFKSVSAATITIPGVRDQAFEIASGSTTPPLQRPVRVTFTLRERINA